MYPVSEDYKTKILQNDRVTRLKGTIVLTNGQVINLNEGDIFKAPTIQNQSSGDNKLQLGGVYQGQLTLTFRTNISRYLIKGAKINLIFGLLIGSDSEDEEDWEEVPLGEFFVTDAIKSGTDKLNITALDCMGNIDKSYEGTVISGSAYSVLSYIGNMTGVQLGQTSEEIGALPNGDETYGTPEVNNLRTYRDILRDLAACLGCFATIGRDGKLYLIPLFDSNVDRVISADYRGNDTISDYQVSYATVMCIKEGTSISVSSGPGQIIDLGSNAFLQLGLEARVKRILNELLSCVSSVTYVPSQIHLKKSDPSYDLADLLKIQGYTAGTEILVPIHKNTWTWRGSQKLISIGEDPYESKTKEQKEIENTANQMKIAENTVLTATNIDEITFDQDWTELCNLRFSVASERTLTFHGVTKFDLSSDASVLVKYELNSETVDFVHEVKCFEGTDTVTLFLPVLASPEQANTLRVLVKASSGTGVIDQYDFKGVIMGSGIITSSWDGIIQCLDSVPELLINGVAVVNIDAAASISLHTNSAIDPSDELDGLDIAGLGVVGIDETINITMTRPTFNITDETGEFNLVTEDGEMNIITE